VDNLVSLTFVEGTVLLCFRECGAVLNWLQASYLRLVLNGTEYLIDGGLSGVKCCSALKARSEFGERIENTCFLRAGWPDSVC